MLTAVNMSRVFTQPLTLVLPRSIEAARTPLLNKCNDLFALKNIENIIHF